MVILSHYFINGRQCYMAEQIHCSFCNFAQPSRPVRNKFGYIQGFTVNNEDWVHSGDCPQKDIKSDKPNEEEIDE